MCAWVSVHTCISCLCLLRGSGKRDTPVATSTPGSCILFLSTVFQKKKPAFLGEVGESRTGVEKIQDEAGPSCGTRTKEVLSPQPPTPNSPPSPFRSKEVLKELGHVQSHRSQPERPLGGQSKNSLSNKMS